MNDMRREDREDQIREAMRRGEEAEIKRKKARLQSKVEKKVKK